jgi:hypothetical protein
MKLNVGVSKKIGLPAFGSAGATCNLELELDAHLLESDLDGFHQRVRSAYVAARQAVHDELARLQGQPTASPGGRSSSNGHRNGDPGHTGDGSRTTANGSRPRRLATPSQVRAITAIARRQNTDLETLLRDEYEVDRVEDLSLRHASMLIDRLKEAAEA